ncbi:MAG: acetylglutamate kinase [Deltaproteobacteria bacterium]|nr:acetylglutamate kinase [Deltaproteobacteria bacterium]
MERPLLLLDAVPYLRAYAGQTFVVKLGGELVGDADRLATVTRDIAVLHRLNIRIVVVHGGGPQLDAMTTRMGLPIERIAGRRVTSPEVLEAAKMVFRGQLSLDLVTALMNQGERAVGLSGVDGSTVQAARRPEALVTDDAGVRRSVDFGEVGDVTGVDGELLESVLASGSIPVVSPLGVCEDTGVVNVNADTMAAEIAIGLGAAKLLLLTRAAGILTDVDKADSLLHWADLDQLKELGAGGSFKAGMRPKIAAVTRALAGGVPRVHVLDGRRDGALLEEVFTTDGCGTLVVAAADDTPAEPLR